MDGYKASPNNAYTITNTEQRVLVPNPTTKPYCPRPCSQKMTESFLNHSTAASPSDALGAATEAPFAMPLTFRPCSQTMTESFSSHLTSMLFSDTRRAAD